MVTNIGYHVRPKLSHWFTSTSFLLQLLKASIGPIFLTPVSSRFQMSLPSNLNRSITSAKCRKMKQQHFCRNQSLWKLAASWVWTDIVGFIFRKPENQSEPAISRQFYEQLLLYVTAHWNDSFLTSLGLSEYWYLLRHWNDLYVSCESNARCNIDFAVTASF